MTDPELVEIFRAAWGGLNLLKGEGKPQRARDYYRYRLRECRDPKTCRSLVAELCAEGGIARGGIAALSQESRLAAFWSLLNSDWQRVRDAALVAGAAVEPPPGDGD